MTHGIGAAGCQRVVEALTILSDDAIVVARALTFGGCTRLFIVRYFGNVDV